MGFALRGEHITEGQNKMSLGPDHLESSRI